MSTALLRSRCYTLIRGSGGTASGIAHALFRAGWPVVLHDLATPAVIRRRMAFTDAVFDGSATLCGVTARRAESFTDLRAMLDRRQVVPLTIAPITPVLAALPWVALIDARMRLTTRVEPQVRLAPLTVGVGPGFAANESVTVAIETAWDHLGGILTRGATAPPGAPHLINGVGSARFIHAPFAGTFRSRMDIGQRVTAGEIIAQVDETPLAAPLSGALRGIARDGVPVAAGAKVIEVDPRGWDAVFTGIGERPFHAGEAVVAVFEAVDWQLLVNAVRISVVP